MVYGGNTLLNSIQRIPQRRWQQVVFEGSSSWRQVTVRKQQLASNIYRYHYVTLVLHRSLSTIQNLPSPWNYGCHGEAYLPILTDELLASISLTEMSMYSCKTKCGTNRCKFRKNASRCTDMCKCVDCENDDVISLNISSITEDKEDA